VKNSQVIFVELDNTIEGLIRLADMNDDFYIFDERNYCVIGEHSKRAYKIGDPLKIKVERVNVDLREIDFSIVKNEMDDTEETFETAESLETIEIEDIDKIEN